MRPIPRAAGILIAALLLPIADASFAAAASGLPGSLQSIEAEYADWLDAGSAVSTIDSGLTERIAGRGRSAWAAQLRDLTAELARAFGSAGAPQPRAEDAQAWQAMRKGFTDSASETPADNSLHPRIVCGDGAGHGGDATTLQIALYACFEDIGSRIDFEGRTMVRTTALQQLQQLEDGARRKRLFLALTPLWTAVNGANTPTVRIGE